MSLETWKEEFLAEGAASGDPAVDLRKWRGLRPANLERHQVHVEGIEVKDDVHAVEPYRIGGDTCGLCHVHDDGAGCPTCPIVVAGSLPCRDERSAYRYWLRTHEPEPMIQVLMLCVIDRTAPPCESWTGDPARPFATWQAEVAAGRTLLGYAPWRLQQSLRGI